MPDLIQPLIQQGGFAVLAGVALWLNARQSDARAADLKAANEREAACRISSEELHRHTLGVVSQVSTNLAALTTRIEMIEERRRTPRS